MFSRLLFALRLNYPLTEFLILQFFFIVSYLVAGKSLYGKFTDAGIVGDLSSPVIQSEVEPHMMAVTADFLS